MSRIRKQFGTGKTRLCCNLWRDNKTNKRVMWLHGKWVNVEEVCKDIDDLLIADGVFSREELES